MKTLHLSLKREWFEMIKSGEKTEEYREINHYWVIRLIDTHKLGAKILSNSQSVLKRLVDSGCVRFKQFDYVEFTLGYPKKDDDSRRILKKFVNISIGKPRPGWCPKDAEGKDYFVIKLR